MWGMHHTGAHGTCPGGLVCYRRVQLVPLFSVRSLPALVVLSQGPLLFYLNENLN